MGGPVARGLAPPVRALPPRPTPAGRPETLTGWSREGGRTPETVVVAGPEVVASPGLKVTPAQVVKLTSYAHRQGRRLAVPRLGYVGRRPLTPWSGGLVCPGEGRRTVPSGRRVIGTTVAGQGLLLDGPGRVVGRPVGRSGPRLGRPRRCFECLRRRLGRRSFVGRRRFGRRRWWWWCRRGTALESSVAGGPGLEGLTSRLGPSARR